MKKTLSLAEVADHLGIHKRTLYTMFMDGRFPVAPVKGSDPRRWNIEDVESWRLGQNQ